jgi:hypothetical protein
MAHHLETVLEAARELIDWKDKTVIPSKIFESMAMEKPIVLGVEGESAELVIASGGGVCIEPENGKDLWRGQGGRHHLSACDELPSTSSGPELVEGSRANDPSGAVRKWGLHPGCLAWPRL